MSLLVWLVVAFLGGALISPVAMILLAPEVDSLAKFLLKQGIRSGDGWVAVQRGNSYDLIQVEYDSSDAKAYIAGDEGDEDREYFEDPEGLMKTLWKTPFGFSFEGSTAVTDAVTAKVGEEYGKLVADGGPIEAEQRFTLSELKERAHIGTIEKDYGDVRHRIEYVNPYVDISDGIIADARGVVSLLSNAGSPETPRQTAENAAQAERAFENWGDLKRTGSIIAAAMVGGLLVYLGMSGGGGGGGASVSLMLTPLGGF